jgi:hypothetical protein
MKAVAILISITASMASGQSTGPTARDVEAAFTRQALKPLWPGFHPDSVARAIYEGQSTWLFHHPRPPAGFRKATEGDAWVYPGRHPEVNANRGILLDSIWTGTLLLDPAVSAEINAGVLIHETFHTFQNRRHRDWVANEVALFEYPVADTSALASRRLETAALRHALAARVSSESACWAAVALEHRAERYASMPESAAQYERASELNEGIADHIEHRATGDTLTDRLPGSEYAPDEFRLRSYASGSALARLLDRFRPGWPSELESRTQPLDSLLLTALPSKPRQCGLPAAMRDSAWERARRDILQLAKDRERKLGEFQSAAGWTLVVNAPAMAPLFPQQFDPLNVLNLGNGRVLHTRHVRMGNDAGFVEAFGRAALTESSARHPLFEGVHMVRITGLAREPVLTRAGDVVRLEMDGIRLEFRHAQVHRGAHVIQFNVGARDPFP